MSISLYYAPRTRAERVRWLLEELEAPHELVRIDRENGGCDTPEYRAVHPLGKIPALKDGDTTLIESAAICLHLADRFAEKGLAPAPGTPERGRYYQWAVYQVATVEPAAMALFMAPDDEAKAKAQAGLKAVMQVVEDALGAGPYLLGETFCAADVLVGSFALWGLAFGWLEGLPNLQAYAERLKTRPAKQRAAEA